MWGISFENSGGGDGGGGVCVGGSNFICFVVLVKRKIYSY